MPDLTPPDSSLPALTADALRLTRQDLGDAIAWVRIAMRKKVDAKPWAGDYLALVRHAHQLREAGLALDCRGPLWEPMAPLPFHPGFVGLTPEEKFRREWRIEPTPMPTQ